MRATRLSMTVSVMRERLPNKFRSMGNSDDVFVKHIRQISEVVYPARSVLYKSYVRFFLVNAAMQLRLTSI